jgi:hypothetical protein
MSHADKRANLQIASRRQSLSTATRNPRLYGFPVLHPIQSSGVVHRPMIGDDKMTLAAFLILAFLVVEARRYEHAGCSTKRSTTLL